MPRTWIDSQAAIAADASAASPRAGQATVGATRSNVDRAIAAARAAAADGATLVAMPEQVVGATPLADKSRIAHMLERVYALFPKLAERRKQQAGTMSGGERQMLAVGRALMSEPKLLLLDEPSLGLAPAIIETMYETFLRLHKEGLTVMLAEQSVDLALEVASYAYVLQVGRSVLSGAARDLLDNPDVQRIYLGVG